eukprot:1138599-Pelagomonas_calceolata.AAC.5
MAQKCVKGMAQKCLEGMWSGRGRTSALLLLLLLLLLLHDACMQHAAAVTVPGDEVILPSPPSAADPSPLLGLGYYACFCFYP